VKRGQVWWVDLGEPHGSEPAQRRPIIIVQDDLLNQSQLQTLMVVPLTTNLKRALARGNVLLEPTESGLPRQSVALVCQVTTVDKATLSDFIGDLPRRVLRKLDRGLTLALGLSA
jgi:mRNA interferase MazF